MNKEFSKKLKPKEDIMKKVICAIIFAFVGSASAYYINGENATLERCSYEQYGNKHGYVGTYKGTSGTTYRVFFENRNDCDY